MKLFKILLMLIIITSITTVSGYNSRKIETKKDTLIVKQYTMNNLPKKVELNGMEFRAEPYNVKFLEYTMFQPNGYKLNKLILKENEYLYGNFYFEALPDGLITEGFVAPRSFDFNFYLHSQSHIKVKVHSGDKLKLFVKDLAKFNEKTCGFNIHFDGLKLRLIDDEYLEPDYLKLQESTRLHR